MRVAIVDGHRMFADTVADRLAAEDDVVVVGTVASVAGAARLRAARPDVVLVDPSPQGAGFAPAGVRGLVRDLRSMLPGARVVVLTSRVERRMLRCSVEAGCDGFLTKDCSSRTLIAAVRSVAAGRAAIAPLPHGEVRGHDAAPSRGGTAPTGSRLDGHYGHGGHDGRAAATAADPAVGLGGLSPREREVLGLLAEGLVAVDIGERLGISRNTARAHVQRVLDKLGVHSRLEAVAVARSAGWT